MGKGRGAMTNAFETTLTAQMGATDLVASVVTTTGLESPCWLVIDPEDDLKREVIWFDGVFTGTQFVTSGIGNRYQEGSAQSSGLIHENGAVVRFSPTGQMFDDLWDELEAHVGGIDVADHPEATTGGRGFMSAADKSKLESLTAGAFLPLTGGTLTGPLALNADPTVPLEAATKQYVDAITAGSGATLPAGSRMIFDMDTAPAGWTRDTSTVDDRMIRIVTGARVDGGDWTQPSHSHGIGAHTHTTPSHNHGNPGMGSAGSHNHSQSSHAHTPGAHVHTLAFDSGVVVSGGTAIGREDLGGAGPQFEYAIAGHRHYSGSGFTGGASGLNNGSSAAPAISTASGHTHTLGSTGFGGDGSTGGASGTSDSGAGSSAWRPLHRDMIIAVAQ